MRWDAYGRRQARCLSPVAFAVPLGLDGSGDQLGNQHAPFELGGIAS